jgi:hypothetical protein
MKKLVFIPIFLFMACTLHKQIKESANDPKIIITSNDSVISTAGEFPLLEPDKMVTVEVKDEGIGLGNIGTIGHGVGMYAPKPKHVIMTSSTPIIEEAKAFASAPEQSVGKVVYDIPKIMSMRETYVVTVRIGKNSVEITENLSEEVRTAVIPITETMEVKLIDPSPDDYKEFEIVADNSAVQMVDSSGRYTQWTWNVTPIKVGSSSLKIVVSVIKNGNKKEDVYSDTVKVEASPMNQVKYFFHTYWQWLFATLLIPVFKYFWGVWRKKKEEEKPKKRSPRKRG